MTRSLTAAVATIGVLGGLIIGQVSGADSTPATSSGSPSEEVRVLRQIKSELETIEKKIGSSYRSNSVLGQLDDIKKNTGETCDQAGGFGCIE